MLGRRVADEVRESIDRLPELYQRGRAVFTNSLEPSGNGFRLDEEGAGGLGERPPPGSLELEDGHSFGRGVVWPASRIDLGQASILDAKLLAEQFDLLLSLVVVAGEPDSGR